MVDSNLKNIDKSGKRADILEAANRLFEMQGFNATGVDQLAAESGVTKRTIYKHFGSKEGLIEAVLEVHHAEMMASTREQLSKVAPEGAARLMACLDLYQDWFAKPNFAGCIFVKTLNEYGQCSARLSAIASRAKQAMRDLLVELAADVGAKDPERLADQLQILLEGCIVVAQAGKRADVIETARPMAAQLIQAAL